MQKDHEMLRLLLEDVVTKSRLGNHDKWKQREYEELSSQIHKSTGTLLSVSTLRRMFQMKVNVRPQKSTLDAMSHFVGYTDWYQYLEQHEAHLEEEKPLQRFADSFRKRLKTVPRKWAVTVLILSVLLIVLLAFTLFALREKPAQLIFSNYPAGLNDPGVKETIGLFYEQLSVSPGMTTEVKALDTLFIPDASILLRQNSNSMVKFTVDGFVKDISHFFASEKILESGYENTIERIEATEYKDIAWVVVHFTSYIKGHVNPTSNGIDVFQLVRTDHGWKIVSVTGEAYQPDMGFPEK